MQQASQGFVRYNADKTAQLMSESGLKGPHKCRDLLCDSGREGDHVFDNEHCNGCLHKDQALVDKAYPVHFFHDAAERLKAGASAVVPVSTATTSIDETEETDEAEDDEGALLPESFYTIPGANGDHSVLVREKMNRKKTELVTIASPYFDILRTEIDDQGLRYPVISTHLPGAAIATMPPDALNDVRELRKGLARAGVAIKSIYDVMEYYQVLCESANDGVLRVDAFGWQKHNRNLFATYDRVYHMKTDPEEIYPGNVDQIARRFQGRVGSVAKWAEVMAPLFQPGAESLLFPVMYSLGSLLMDPLGLDEVAVVSLYSPHSGTGKTSCLLFSSSLWGRPVRSHVNANDTLNYKMNMFEGMRNLPVMIDEITTVEAEELGPLIYSMVGGFSRGRASRDGSNQARQEWRTCFVITTNSSVWLTVGHQPALVDRVLEIRFNSAPLDQDTAKGMLSGIDQCHGVVGPAFFDHIRKIPISDLQQAFFKCREHVTNTGTTGDRFTLNALALAALTTRICSRIEDMNLPEDTYKRLVMWSREREAQNVRERRQEKRDASYQPGDFFSYAQLGLRGYPKCNLLDTSSSYRDTPLLRRIYKSEDYLFFFRDSVLAWIRETDRNATERQARKLISEWIQQGICDDKGRSLHLNDFKGQSKRMYRLQLSACGISE